MNYARKPERMPSKAEHAISVIYDVVRSDGFGCHHHSFIVSITIRPSTQYLSGWMFTHY